jgi:hypothetical protein
LPSRRKPIGTGGRGLPEIDEDALIKRYTLAGVSIAGCARQFRVSPERVKRILAAHGVEVRGPAVPPDQAAVVAAYQRHQSVSYVASALGIHDKKVREILSAHGVKTPRPPRPLLSMEYADPAPADRITGAQAARLLGTSWAFIDRAAAAGQIGEERDDDGRRRFIRGDIEALRQRLRLTRPGDGPVGAEDRRRPPGGSRA